jgi:3,4-dihydroxy-2-butanone 4-phosphate synthase
LRSSTAASPLEGCWPSARFALTNWRCWAACQATYRARQTASASTCGILGDAGLARLGEALPGGRYRVELPEDAALLTVAWLLRNGGDVAALDLVTEIRPFMSRLRFTPRFAGAPRPRGATVRLRDTRSVAEDFRAMAPRPQVAAMRDTLRTWNPLFDRLVSLWCGTVEGDLPYLSDGAVAGGWPCRRWPADWRERRHEWLADYRSAVHSCGASGSARAVKSNFTRLRIALEHCETGSGLLTARDVGWIRRALANTLTRHGDPASPSRTELRARQMAVAERPAHAAIAQKLAERLDEYPADSGIPSVDAVTTGIGDGDTARVPVPPHLRAKVARALEELPWIAAMASYRATDGAAEAAAGQALAEVTLVAMAGFPQAIVPNKLVREMSTLAARPGVHVGRAPSAAAVGPVAGQAAGRQERRLRMAAGHLLL